MIVIAGWIRVAASERDAYLGGCTVVMEAAEAAPGCLDFVLSADPLRVDRIRIYERWETDAELDAFRGSGPPAQQAAQILDASVARYRISAVEDA